MKTPRSFNETRQTCDTDDSDQVEHRASTFLLTRPVSSLLFPSFKNREIISKAGFVLPLDCDEDLEETLSEEEDSQYAELMKEINEEYSHHWLPCPSYVHPGAMDYPTPKRAFSPNKPRGVKMFN